MNNAESLIQVKKYCSSDQETWNDFIKTTRQKSILFDRNYIDYHQDRFIDYSLLFYSNNKLLSVLPANKDGSIIYSHQGLTFSGLLYSTAVKSKEIILIVEALLNYLKEMNFSQFIYKPSPHIYNQYFAEEDIYALAKQSSLVLDSIEISTAIAPDSRGSISSIRKRGIAKSIKNGLSVKKDNEHITDFYDILTSVLKITHNTNPVHSLSELNYLINKFPEAIQLWSAFNIKNELVAGCIIYESTTVAHIQYIAASNEGKTLSALDLLFDQVIAYYLNKKIIVEFGKSTENHGKDLNAGLIYQKESFGGFAINYYTYSIHL